MATKQNLSAELVNQLETISGKAGVTEDSTPAEFLEDTKGAYSAKTVFQTIMFFIMLRNGFKRKRTPANWFNTKLKDIASMVSILMLVLFSFTSQAQLEVKLGALKTENKANAIAVGIRYVQTLDSLYSGVDLFYAGKRSALLLTPDINIETGTQDAFSSINAKLTGLYGVFKTIQRNDMTVPDTKRGFHTFPISAGVETNNFFNAINGIGEVGWVPWFSRSSPLRFTKVGVFVQGGYKFVGPSAANQAIGGQKDESLETVNNGILRLKGHFEIDTKQMVTLPGLNAGLVGRADVWQDVLHGKTYYRVEGVSRFYLNATQYLDFVYQKGSGAPNFNEGDQFGINLTVRF